MITGGTGNVFADLGHPDAEERQTKLRLAHAINGDISSAADRITLGRAGRDVRPFSGAGERSEDQGGTKGAPT